MVENLQISGHVC